MTETDYKVLPRNFQCRVLEKHPEFSYSVDTKEKQLTWVQFNFDGFDLAITLDCDEERHSMKFVVLGEER